MCKKWEEKFHERVKITDKSYIDMIFGRLKIWSWSVLWDHCDPWLPIGLSAMTMTQVERTFGLRENKILNGIHTF